MKKVSLIELKPGMVTAEDVLNYDMKMVVPKGVVLTENIISRLESYSIYYVSIENEVVEQLYNKSVEPSAKTEAPIPESSKSRIYNSEQFAVFSRDFNQCADHFKDSLMKALYKHEPFNAEGLLSETMQLMKQGETHVSVFDMLLNMRNIDDSIYAHCIDVALISNMLARWLHFSEEEQRLATACGLFHDVGKFMLPQTILRKPDRLTAEEFEIVKTHTTEGLHLLSKFSNIPKEVRNAALMHHEKCDGSGYPYGLKGDEIDNYSKIVTIADIFDAMTSERVYRSAMCPFTVIKAFEDEGIQKYDPKYILTFLENVANSYLNHRVSLSNGMEGNVIFINQSDYSLPIIKCDNDEIINLQEQYYQNIMKLSNQKNVSIESII